MLGLHGGADGHIGLSSHRVVLKSLVFYLLEHSFEHHYTLTGPSYARLAAGVVYFSRETVLAYVLLLELTFVILSE